MAIFIIVNTETVINMLIQCGYESLSKNYLETKLLKIYTGNKFYDGQIPPYEVGRLISEDELASLLLIDYKSHKTFIEGLKHDSKLLS